MKTAAVAWLFFIITGVFVSLVVPLGEGFDEPWHFGYIQYVAQTRKLPPGPHLHLSVEIEAFLQHHPMGWRLHDIFPNLRTQEDYWHQADADRRVDDSAIQNLRFSGSYVEARSKFTEQYESHQAPLYYVISAVPFLLFAKFLSLADTFLLLRIWSVALASAVVPFSYMLAKRVSSSHRGPQAVAALAALFPGIYPDIARVSNDALVVPLAAATFLALSRFVDSPSRPNRVLLAILLLAALCTKAFFVPVLASCFAVAIALRQYRAAATIALASAPGWFWYIRNAWITGSVTGLPETVSANSTIASSIGSVGTIRWYEVLKLAAVSHIWMGNWSLLQYRSWIYQTVMVLFALGIAGFILYLRRASCPGILALCAVYGLYCLSLIYYATQVFQQTGVPVIQGWYLSPLIPIEALTFVIGVEFLLPRRSPLFILPVFICFLAMIVYGNAFIAAPYYSGVIEHAPSGHLRSYHPRVSDISLISSRLTRFHSWLPNVVQPILALAVILTGFLLIWTYYDSSRSR